MEEEKALALKPIGFVVSERKEAIDDDWHSVAAYIELTDEYSEDCLVGLADFSHVEILYYFHKADRSTIICGAEHPRENKRWPKVGIFAQRKKARPNLLGTTIAKIIKIDGKRIILSGLDAIDGSPVIDIKPVFIEFLPKEVRQPDWVSELMKKYW